MSSKTRIRNTRTTTSTTRSAPTLRAVPDGTAAKVRTDTEDKLWAALHAHPNTTATALSTAAKIGKSTAQKILAKWAGDGSVTRTPGIAEGGRRAADLWTITDVDVAQADSAHADDTTSEDGVSAAGTAQIEVDVPTAVPVAPDNDDATPAGATDSGLAGTATAADDAQDPVEPEAAAPEKAESVAVVSRPVNRSAAAGAGTKDGTTGSDKMARLAPGALRGMVEDHLRDHSDLEFSPVEMARKVGGRSTGAVSNALDKLVDGGIAVKTKDKPKRFALASTEQVTNPALTT